MTMQKRKSLRFRQLLSNSGVVLFLIGFLVFVVGATPVLAQQTGGRLTGTVSDASGGVVPGAMVSATNEATMITSEALTNDSGVYSFSNLLPGTYTVSAEMDGFTKSTVTNFLLETATTKRVNFNLVVGDINQEVTVVSQAVQQIQHETSDLGDVVYERKIKDLPLNGRRPIELVLLQPGMAGNPGQGNAGGFAASGRLPEPAEYQRRRTGVRQVPAERHVGQPRSAGAARHRPAIR